jgi:hypothetical protein
MDAPQQQISRQDAKTEAAGARSNVKKITTEI